MEEDLEIIMKIIVVGDGRIGKTNLITRFARGTFSQEYKKTLGVDFLQTEKFLKKHKQEVQFYIWDTAGQEEYDALTKKYYKGASACILAFSTDDKKSFENVEKWKSKVENECGDLPMVLVQTKYDLKDNQAFSEEEVSDLQARVGVKLFRSCSKENINVTEVFEYLGNVFLDEKNAGKGHEESKSQGPVATIKDIKKANDPVQKNQVKLSAQKSSEPKKKKKGIFGS